MTRGYVPPITISRKDYLSDGTDSRFRESIYAMVQSVSRLLAFRDTFGKAFGLTASQFAVIMGVAYKQGEDGVTIRDLADHVALASTHVTTEVGRLQDKGLVTKRASSSDRRSVLVSLTPFGEEEIARVAPLVRSINDLLFQDISPDQLMVARNVARTIILNSEYASAELRRRQMQSASS